MALLLPLAACEYDVNPYAIQESDTEDTSEWQPDGGDSDGGDGDPDDQDGDGVTPEEGDCDDTDFRVGPDLPEREDNEKDDDCDGRVDEEWDGVAIAYAPDDGEAQILELTQSGKIDETIGTGTCVPIFLDYLADDSGWLVNCGLTTLATLSRDGDLTEIADFSETDYGLWGVTVAADGTWYGTTVDSLVRIETDGTFTTVAAWDPETEIVAVSVSTDPRTGTVGIFDYYGGFSSWNAADGLTIHIQADFESPKLSTVSGAHQDGGGWCAPAADLTTGSYGISCVTADLTDWEQRETWSDEDWSPFMLAMDGDDPEHPDYYVTATAGWYQTVWRIVGGTDTALNFYVSEGTEPGTFYGIASRG